MSEQKREIVLRMALSKGLVPVLFLMLEKNSSFELEHEDLRIIAKLQNEELITRIVESRSILVWRRSRGNYARNILERLTSAKASKGVVRYIDIISAKIDQLQSNESVMETAKKITESDEKEAVLCLFIVRRAYKLFKRYYRFRNN